MFVYDARFLDLAESGRELFEPAVLGKDVRRGESPLLVSIVQAPLGLGLELPILLGLPLCHLAPDGDTVLRRKPRHRFGLEPPDEPLLMVLLKFNLSAVRDPLDLPRSEEHTSELQSH